ncbi:NADH dehydrogenase [ubiquinone] 1 alpha subcomplex subunit 5 [Odontomachus brunneus]|uniref:NADH dehydrogenase [ubiquinone] 1 alpha subcomplex subunit 5 n=1 Tax=Odontomachus brunneus TaxID=486640 RepID=UPI0013F22DC2|nr:NADH dehydrogenase [ubiquinone] 1 alpha subcomplex subunit 5 [Odontomachus brunneus]
MAGVLKKTTRLTGLVVSKTPHQDIIPVYNRILKLLDKFPENYTYRTETEKLVKYRLSVVESNKDVQTIEEKIDCGQFEELVIQAKNELSLAQQMLEWKAWENLMQEAPPNQWTWPPHK